MPSPLCGKNGQWLARYFLFLGPLLLVACGGGSGGGGSTAGGPATPELAFTASSPAVAGGDSITLAWNAANAQSCEASGAWSGSKALQGSASLVLAASPADETRSDTFVLTCRNASGSTEKSVQVAVQADRITAALLSGDGAMLNRPDDGPTLAELAWQQATQLEVAQQDRLRAIHAGNDSAYDPGQHSQWINVGNPESAQTLIVGDKGHALASLSTAGGGRAAAYGVNLLDQFRKNLNSAHMPTFKRLLAWLLTDNAGQALPATLTVAWGGIDPYWAKPGFAALGINASSLDCDVLADDSCSARADLLILGSDAAASAAITPRVQAWMQAGKPLLFLHTSGWGDSPSARQVLTALGLDLGPYAGNYFEQDAVASGRSDYDMVRQNDQLGRLVPLLDRLARNNFRNDYDWSLCRDQDCNAVAAFNNDILAPADFGGLLLNSYNSSARQLFATPDTRLLRLLSLWADVTRQQIRYPLSKNGDQAAFQKAVVADAWVTYVRERGLRQPDLGSFMSDTAASLPVSGNSENISVTLPASNGVTAIGRLAMPGQRFLVTLQNAGSAKVSLRLNTQRPGSTRWGRDLTYNRPRFLASPKITLAAGQAVPVLSPYGGTLQLEFSNATPGQTVTLALQGVARHPFLDFSAGGSPAAFIQDLNSSAADWAEIKLNGVEVHTRVDMMKNVLGSNYGNDGDRYLSELRTLFFDDAYQLAGFSGFALPAAVQTFCNNAQWDCTDAGLHRAPGTQHVNVDRYAQCGASCSGNPYDQTGGLDPRGEPESHELGHNLQVGNLMIYGGISGEISNEIFPLHKAWRLYRDYNDNRTNFGINYQSAFNMIKNGRQAADPVDAVYQQMWKDSYYRAQNSERKIFYTQWMHYWAERMGSVERGWDIFTLLYLHERQLRKADWASYKDRLGYSRYASRPAENGNDNMLIALSWITRRDQRGIFDMWGIRYSAEASAQVASYGFATEPAFFYAKTAQPLHDYSDVRRIDMTVANPVWPF